MWDLKIDTRRLAEGFSTSVLWDRPNVLWNKADDWWNDNYVTDSNTAAFLSATGIIDPNKQNYINNLVIALKNQGLWNKAKAIYPFVSEQRNLLNYTEDFSNSYWQVLGGALKAPNYAAAPNGTTTGCRVYNGGALQTAGISKEIGTYVFSFYVKMTAGGTGTLRVFLDGGVTTTVVNVTASWTRVQVSKTFATVDSGTVGFFVDSDVLIWGPQFELGSTATDYQVTINAQEQFAAAYKYNLKDPQDTDAAFRLKIFGTWTFTPTGAKPNGTNAYMDTSFVPNVQLTSNQSGSLSFYSGTIGATNSNGCSFGAYDGVSETDIIIKWSDGNAYLNINQTVYNNTFVNADSHGFYVGNRNAVGTQQGWKNGIKVFDITNSPTTKTNKSLVISARNDPSSIGYYDTKRCQFASMGDGLTDTEALALNTIVQQFQTALNRQV
jgi:hypothetical protein